MTSVSPSFETYWRETTPEPAPGGVVGDGQRISQTLRKGIGELEGELTIAYELAEQAIAAESILPDGQLTPPADDNPDAERWYYDISPPLVDMPNWIGSSARHQTIPLTRRERNLVATGAELLLCVIQKWVQQDGTPYPPPDSPPSHSSPHAQLRAARFPIDCP
jgi:hypothetical protein